MIINKKSKKINKKNIIKIVIPILVIILVIIAISNNVKNTEKQKEIEKIKSYTSIDDFKTIEEVAIYMDCEYIKEEPSKTEGYTTDIYLEIKLKPFTNSTSNKEYYEKLFAYCAKVVQYKNFIIIDKTNELVIAVNCNTDNKVITNYNINGNDKYFQTEESRIAKENYIEIKEIAYTINSTELKQIIQQNWNVSDSIFGTKDSVFQNYNIYFDEGISVRKINKTIFNIVFDSKYKQEIINGITTSSTKQEIIEKLGAPQFEQNEIIGYKTENTYIFFYKNEVSVYKNEKNTNTLEFAKLVEQYQSDKDLIKFTTNLKNVWTDYDLYNYDSNYVVLQYSLKGISIRYNYKKDNGIYMYSNFTGNITPNTTHQQIINGQSKLPNEVYIKNENLVLTAEKERISNKNTITYDLANVIQNHSKEFIIDIITMKNSTYEISFISKLNQNPNRELREYINYGIWLDDENFIYSVKQKGIYKYNVKTNTYTTLITGDKDEFKILKLQNGILEYDETTLKI